MPMRSVPIRDEKGRVIGQACYRERYIACATAGCTSAGALLCDYPVTRRGKPATCNRRVCLGCARSVGPELDYCPPHARLWDAGAPERAEEERMRKILAEFKPVKEPDDGG